MSYLTDDEIMEIKDNVSLLSIKEIDEGVDKETIALAMQIIDKISLSLSK